MSSAREWLTKVKRKFTGPTSLHDVAEGWNGNLEHAKETIIRWATQDAAELSRTGAVEAVVDAVVDQASLREKLQSDQDFLVAFLDPLMLGDSPWKSLLALVIGTGDVLAAQALKNMQRKNYGASEAVESKAKLESDIETILQTIDADKDTKLVPLYTELAETNHKLLDLAELEAERKSKLSALVSAGKHRQSEIEAEIASTKVHAHAAQASKQQREETLLPKLAEVKDERAAVDKRLEELENVKHRLKVELEKITQEIVQVTEQQKTLMAKEETVNQEINGLKISTAEALNEDCDKEELLHVEARAKTETISLLTELLKTNDADKKLLEVRALVDASDEVAKATVDRHAAALVARAGGDSKDGNIVEDVRKLVEKFSLRFLSDDRKKELQNLV